MIRDGQRIRLTGEENAFFDGLVQEHVSPRSVADYNAWLDHAIRDLSKTDPEGLLFRRVLEQMKIGGWEASDLAEERIAIYASVSRAGVVLGGHFTPLKRYEIKLQVQSGEIRLVIGTDAASEGLNLQRRGTLVNLDLPWNPTRLEQRKGRIQRIGQVRDVVDILNMRYKGSVEDRVHQLLAERLENIYDMFGKVPDTLEDVWVDVALGEITAARQVIVTVPKTHPFEMRYDC